MVESNDFQSYNGSSQSYHDGYIVTCRSYCKSIDAVFAWSLDWDWPGHDIDGPIARLSVTSLYRHDDHRGAIVAILDRTIDPDPHDPASTAILHWIIQIGLDCFPRDCRSRCPIPLVHPARSYDSTRSIPGDTHWS